MLERRGISVLVVPPQRPRHRGSYFHRHRSWQHQLLSAEQCGGAACGGGKRQLPPAASCRCFLRSPCEIQSLLHGPCSNLVRVESVHHAVRSYRAGTGRQSVPTVHQNGTRPRSACPVNGRSITQERKTPRFWATYFHHPEKNEKVKLLLAVR